MVRKKPARDAVKPASSQSTDSPSIGAPAKSTNNPTASSSTRPAALNGVPTSSISDLKGRHKKPSTPNGVVQPVPYQDRKVDRLMPSRQGMSQKKKQDTAQTNGVEVLGRTNVDDARAVVMGGADVELARPGGTDEEHQAVVEISSDEDDEGVYSSADEDDEGSDEEISEETKESSAMDGGPAKDAEPEDDEMADADGVRPAELESSEPSFGDRLLANAAEPIDVEAELDESNVAPTSLLQLNGPRMIQAPSASSLGTVLTQSLRTNDSSLLESCLYSTDLDVIRATLERLDSSLAATLLHKLADRLHRRPGRAGNLMVWVQWTLVSHGGYLASQPQLMSRLNSLHRVVKERASGLSSLLLLKGKLDMLEAQMQLRRNMQGGLGDIDSEDADEERVIYVEGQEEPDDSEEAADTQPPKSRLTGRTTLSKQSLNDLAEADDGGSDDDEGEDEMPTTLNGVMDDSEVEAASESDEGIFDDEAEETDADTGDESGDEQEDDDDDDDDLDADDVDADVESESEVEMPPAKRPAVGPWPRSLFGRRT